MITLRVVLACVAMCCLLLLADIALRVRHHRRDSLSEQFSFVPVHTNGVSGVTVADRTENKPLWAKWTSEKGGMVSLFIDGRLALNVTTGKEGRTETEVFFYDRDGKLISQWQARETGVFYMRTLFGEDGTKSEFWLNDRWHNVEVRTNAGQLQSGIVVDGKWRHVVMRTNGVLGINP